MNLTSKLLSVALLGSEWILWLLIALSVVSVVVIVDRIRYFAARKVDMDQLISDFRSFLKQKDVEGAHQKYSARNAIEILVGLAGLKESGRGPNAASQAMTGAKTRARQDLERNLTFLATIGNNAPFIGLLGTVLGIIKAFKDLALNSQAGAESVMAGISEALVATAVGLFVAIPAVLAFNIFNRRKGKSLANADAVSHAILTELSGPERRQ